LPISEDEPEGSTMTLNQITAVIKDLQKYKQIQKYKKIQKKIQNNAGFM